MSKEAKLCDRCGEHPGTIKHEFTDEYDGEKCVMMLCWDCDFDIINGRGDYFDDDAAARHAEEDYEYDPTYYPKPSWLP